MGLRLNHISASHGGASKVGGLFDGAGRNAIGVSGSMYFAPSDGRLAGWTGSSAAAANASGATGGPGFLGNPDAAYIFSGSVGGDDKALFLGDVVVSGSLSLGDGSALVDSDGTGTLHEVAIFKDANTIKGDAKLVYNSSADELIYGGAVLDVDTTGAIELDADAASNLTTSSGALTLDGAGGVNIAGNAAEIDITTTGAVDINGAAISIDGSTVSIDSTDNINITAAGSGKTLDIDASGALTIDSATSIAIGANADKPVDIDSTTLDIDASDAITIDGTAGISIDAGAASNFTTSVGGLSFLAQQNHANGKVVLSGSSGADSVHIQSAATVVGTLTLASDLIVNGTTTTVNSTTVTVDDPVFTLGGDTAPSSDDNKDRGIEFRYHDGSSAAIGFMGWDDSASGFTLLSAASNSSEVFSGTASPLVIGGLTSTSVIVADGGTVGSATIADALTISSGGDVTVKAAKSIKVDTIVETTTDGGVTVEGVKIVAGSGTTTMGVASDVNKHIEFGNSSGNITFKNDSDASSTTSGPVIFSGGIGVGKDLHVGDDLSLASDGAILNFGKQSGGSNKVRITHVAEAGSFTAPSDSFSTKSGLNTPSAPSTLDSSVTEFNFSSGTGAAFAEGEIVIFVNASGNTPSKSIVYEVTTAASNSATTLAVRHVGTVSFSANSFSGTVVSSMSLSSDVSIANTIGFTGASASFIGEHLLHQGADNAASGLAFRAEANKIFSSGTGLLDIEAATKVILGVGGEVLSVDSNSVNLSQALLPTSDNAIDLGSSAARFANIYTGDLNLRNDRGDWTLIEEEDFISFRNNSTGRRFRMVMEDITGLGTYGPGNDGEM
jgi:hypothetical protein